MGVQLIKEVLDRAPADLTSAELVVLLVLAENGRDSTREAFPGLEALSRRCRLSPTGLRTAFQRLAARGLEVRVAIGTDRIGRAVYAYEGRQTTYRVPEFVASGDVSTSPGGDTNTSALSPSGDVNRPERRRETARVATPARRPSRQSPHNPVKTEPTVPSGTVDPEKLIEPLSTIARSLDGLDATIEETKAIHKTVIERHHPRNVISYCRQIAADGGFAGYLADIRAAGAEQRRRDIEEQRRTAEPCEHGQPGGMTIRTSAGEPSCALCRRGVVSSGPETGTGDRIAEVLTVYRAAALAAGGDPTVRELIEITRLASREPAA